MKNKKIVSLLLSFVPMLSLTSLTTSCSEKSSLININNAIFEPFGTTVFFVAENDDYGHGPSNVQEIDLLSINNDIIANNIVLDFLQKNVSRKITFNDFFLLNNAIAGTKLAPVDYSQEQQITISVYADASSSLISGNFDFFCLVRAIGEVKTIEHVFKDLSIQKTFNVEVKDELVFDKKEITTSITNDSFLHSSFLKEVASTVDFINEQNIDFNCQENDIEESKISLTLKAKSDIFCQNRIIRNSVLLTRNSETKVPISYDLVNEVFDVSSSTLDISELKINSKNPYTVGKEELTSTIINTLKKNSLIEEQINNSNSNKKHPISWDLIKLSFPSLNDIYDLTTPKNINLVISFDSNSKYCKGFKEIIVKTSATDISLDISIIKITDNPQFGIDAVDQKMVKISEIASLSYNQILSDYVYKKIDALSQSKINAGVDYYLSFNYEQGDYSNGKIVKITVNSNPKSMSLKGVFSFNALVCVNKTQKDISELPIKVKDKIIFNSVSPTMVVDPIEVSVINSDQLLINSILAQLKTTNLNIQKSDFYITNSAKLNVNYYSGYDVDITIHPQPLSLLIKGSLKIVVKVWAEQQVFDLKNLVFENLYYIIDVVDSANVQTKELDASLQKCSQLRTAIFTEVRNHTPQVEFGIDFDYFTNTDQKNFSSTVEIEIIIQAWDRSKALTGTKKQKFFIVGNNLVLSDNYKYNASFPASSGGKLTMEDTALKSGDGKEMSDCVAEVDTIDLMLNVDRNKLWSLYGTTDLSFSDLLASGAVYTKTDNAPTMTLNGGFLYSVASLSGKSFRPKSFETPNIYDGVQKLRPEASGEYEWNGNKYIFGVTFENLMSLFTYTVTFEYAWVSGAYYYTPKLHSKRNSDSVKGMYNAYFWADEARKKGKEFTFQPADSPKVEWES